jgi:hypothetical protein
MIHPLLFPVVTPFCILQLFSLSDSTIHCTVNVHETLFAVLSNNANYFSVSVILCFICIFEMWFIYILFYDTSAVSKTM